MRPWILGRGYDRPIPRRLVEEAGVARDLFGGSKKAVTQPFHNRDCLKDVMSARSYLDFVAYARGKHLFPGKFSKWRFEFMCLLYRLNLRLNWKAAGVFKATRKSILTRPIINDRYRSPIRINSFLFHWGCEKIRNRYARD